MITKFHVSAVEGSGEESSDWDPADVLSIEVDVNGTLTIFTTDDSTGSYLEDEWSSLSIVR